ncbi:uncharacterized protein LOC135211613 [Macrobrachium nipponense]|uniref:uncharacterized protein LOC135211613 n=1 Tax=Macrobrachium nipponense TaxID=159736 RepID=UPI0030C81DE9
MKFLLVLLVVGVCSSQRLKIPDVSDEEVKGLLSNVPAVVDCLIEGRTAGGTCHPLTNDVRRFLPELAAQRFQCNCPAQRHINAFRDAIQRDRAQFRRMADWAKTSGLLA